MKDSKAIDKAVIELHSYSLNTQSSGNRILSFHSLVHKHAGTTLEAQQRRQLSQRVVKMVTAAFDSGHGNDTKSWTYELSILPHARCCSDILQQELAPQKGPLDVETRELAYRLARAYSRLGHVRGVAALYKLGLRDVEPQSARDPKAVVGMMNSFGISLRLQAKYGEATEWHALAKEFVEKVSPPLDPLMALEAEQHMAAILMDQCRYGEAKEALERVLQQQQGRLGEKDASSLREQAQHDLGMVLLHLGELDRALKEFKAVQQLRKKRHGDNHPMTLEAAHSVATALQEMGKERESLDKHQEILQKRKEYLGVEHYSTLDTMDSIALLYERQGKYDEALQMSQEVQRKLEDILLEVAVDHPWLLRVRSRTADIELRLGKYDAARESYESVHRGFRARGMMLNDAWPAQTNIARVLRDVGKYDEALSNCEEALRGLQEAEKPGGGDPGFVIAAEFCKATILELQGRFGEALQLYDEVARKEEERFGPDDLDASHTKCFAGSAMAKLGRCEEALQLYEDIEEKLQRCTDGLGHSLIKLLANHNKADVLEQLGRCEEALTIYGEVCSTKRELRLENQAEYYRAVHGKGKACIRKGELEEGLGFLRDAIEGWKKVFGGSDHPLIFAALEDTGNALLLLQGGAQLSEARSRCGEALDGCRKMLRDQHPQRCRAGVSLSVVLAKQNRLEEASKECAAGLRGLRAELGSDHPWALRAARTLAGIKWRQRRYWEACRLYIPAAIGLRKKRGPRRAEGRGSLAP